MAKDEFTPPRGDQPCPCGSGKTLAQCCDPILKQQRPAATAEELMRSRFTAHVAHDWQHLHRTFAGTANEPYEPQDDAGARHWTRLVIHSHELSPRPDTAFVDFTAYYKEGDAEHALLEKGEFHRVNGAWLYTRAVRQGPAPIKSTQAKVGRNDPCPCGSGKKYKQCCLAKGQA
jgi:SEC-C motif-containing protein